LPQTNIPTGNVAALPLPPVGLQTPIPLPNTPPPTQTTPSIPLPNSTQVVLPPIPKSQQNYNTASLPKGQSLKILPPGGFQVNDSFQAPRTSRSFPQAYNTGDIRIGEPKPVIPSNMPELRAANLPNGLPVSPYPNSSPSTPVPVPSDLNNVPQTPQQTDNTSTPEVVNNQELVAPLAETPRSGDKLALAEQSLPQFQGGAKVPNLSSQTPAPATETPPSQGTRVALSQLNSYEDLINSVKRDYPDAELKSPIRQTLTSQKPGVEGVVMGGLVVDQDGKVIDVKFQQESELSPEAKAAVREHFRANPVVANGKQTHYPFNLRFQNSTTNAAIPEAVTKPSGTVEFNRPSSATPGSIPQSLPRLRIRNIQPTPTVSPTTADVPNQVDASKPAVQVPVTNIQPTPKPETATKLPLPNSVNQIKPRVEIPKASSQSRVTNPQSRQEIQTSQPLSARLRIRDNQPTPKASTEVTSNNQAAPVNEGNQKLLRKLRQVREERQSKQEN
jgi:hypothetical protein